MEKTKKQPNAIVIRPFHEGGISKEWVEPRPSPQWLLENRFYYLLYEKEKDGEKELLDFGPSQQIKLMSDSLYRALRWETVRRLLSYKATMLDKINMWIGVALVGILAFIIFIILGGQ